MKVRQSYMYPLYTLAALLFSSVLFCTSCDGQEDPTTSEQSVNEDSPVESSNNTKQPTTNKPADSSKPSPPRSSVNTKKSDAVQGDKGKQEINKELQAKLAQAAKKTVEKKQQKKEELIAKMQAMKLGSYTNGTIQEEMGTLKEAKDRSGINTLLEKAKKKAIGETAQGEYYKVVKQVCEAFLIEAEGDYKKAIAAIETLPGLAEAYDQVLPGTKD